MSLSSFILRKKIELATKALATVVDAAVSQAADLVVAEQKRRAPKDTGALANSIHKQRNGVMSYKVKAGGSTTTKDGYDYAVGQEFGNHHAPAQPYFYPGYRAQKPSVRAKIKAAINNELKAALK